ncbi:hypothetical protein [Marmoricola sp. RAF53]|uniref:hypothetical protein n=1 Tax=Marmoricola sp. RAF53 TaxID=3233059 RepID=UPI003F9DC68B
MIKRDMVVQLQVMSDALANPPDVVPEIGGADDAGAMPAELRRWLVSLRLLEAVPFSYLVADSALLPEESIRWFYLDRRWTDALVMGALSVGTVNSDDRTHLAAQYPAVRSELDREERQVRRAAGADRLSADEDGGPVSGFLLRSKAVSGWPALHVRAFKVDPDEADDAKYDEDDPRRLRLLRLERLAPAVLLCLFDGIPEVVHIEEPRQGVQFGFTATRSGSTLTAQMRPRSTADFSYLSGQPVDVPFRSGASGVVDVKQLEKALKPRVGSGAADGLDSAEYALQLVQLPWRQVWGDAEEFSVSSVFKATVKYSALTRTFTREQP